MATRPSTIVIDDLTGAELWADARTVTFALDGVTYEIDLAPSAAEELREALAPFIRWQLRLERARRAAGGRRRVAARLPRRRR